MSIKFLEDIKKEVFNDPTSDDIQGQINKNGFALPPVAIANGNGLPTMKNYGRYTKAKLKRNIISWLVPEIGLVKMYINPESISINDKKLIQKEQTKGGFSLQYWGEDLKTIRLSGTTGSSGIEGVNLLHEIYRAEQHVFDGTALTIANKNAATTDLISKGVDSIFSGVGSLFGGGSTVSSILGLGAGLTKGALGVDSSLAPSIIPSLAQYAFTVEMFYDGLVHRGYFTDMSVTEATDFLFKYDISFTVTQTRGYRTNYLGWHKSPNNAPSRDNPESPYSAYGDDYSFDRKLG
jgi:hypothetical protein